jgi:uncharacterized low-complexity protein
MRKLLLSVVMLFAVGSANAEIVITGSYAVVTALVGGAYFCGKADQANGTCLKADVPKCLSDSNKAETVKAGDGNYTFTRYPEKCYK